MNINMNHTLYIRLAPHLKKQGDRREVMFPYGAVSDNLTFFMSKPDYPNLISEDNIELKVVSLYEVETRYFGYDDDKMAEMEQKYPGDWFKKTAYYKARELYNLKLDNWAQLWKDKLGRNVGECLVVMVVERV